MGLVEQAKNDIREITSNLNEFGVSLTLTDRDGQTATITGLHTKHHLGFDIESGTDKVIKNAHASFSEELLSETNPDYTIRDSDGKVDMQGHRIDAADSTGTTCSYLIDQAFPDETVGLIMCILGDMIE